MIQRRVFARVAADLAYRLPRVRAEAFDAEHGPERVNRFFDVLTVQKVGGLLLLDGITVVLQAAFGLLILAFYHPYMLTFDVVLLIVLTFIVFQLGRGAIRTSIRESRAKYAVAGALQEMARADVAFKTGRAPEFAIERADRLTRSYLLARRDHFHILMRQIIFALGTQAVATAALLGLGGWLVIERQLTLGQLVAAELVVATVVGSFTKLGKHLEGWYDLMAAVEKLGHLVDLPLERHGGEAPLFDGAGIAIALRDVSYSYDEHHDALQGLSLEIAAGEHVAIVGPSGSGRSTLAQLLYGLRAPSRGSVTYDGLNLSDLDLEAVRDHVALVHDIDVVEDSILDNVRMGRHGVTLRAVYQALEAVRLSEEVARLPHGLHTRLSASGSPLSRGQARRLMLARALAGKPKVVILDEALDGLELDARGAVLDSFFAAQAGFTLVVITSSPEVAARCGRTIAVVRDGDGKSQALENGRAARLDLWMNEVKA
jgi:ABC-type bacteriocin/lantibiotic exporter with double-glycine peptidase domain